MLSVSGGNHPRTRQIANRHSAEAGSRLRSNLLVAPLNPMAWTGLGATDPTRFRAMQPGGASWHAPPTMGAGAPVGFGADCVPSSLTPFRPGAVASAWRGRPSGRSMEGALRPVSRGYRSTPRGSANMNTKTLLSPLLSLLLALPAAPAWSFSLPSASSNGIAVKKIRERAFDAGVVASQRVFPSSEETTDGLNAIAQSNNELRTICLSDCERELQQCQSDRRAGVHTQNCSAILDACTDVCWARWPAPPVDEGADLDWLWTILALGLGALIYLGVGGEETDDSY